MNVLDANPLIIRKLKESGRIIRHDTYEHNYPHCWRTDTPIIYRAVPSWYVKVTEIKDRLVEINQEINWIPENVRGRTLGNGLKVLEIGLSVETVLGFTNSSLEK